MRIIRKEIVIEGSPEKVWRHLTDPAKVAGWLMPTDFAGEVGRAFYMDCDEEGKITGVVKEAVEGKRLVYTFVVPGLQVETTVTISLMKEGNGTRLVLEHTGWEKLPPSQEGAADMFEQGWSEKLQELKKKVES